MTIPVEEDNNAKLVSSELRIVKRLIAESELTLAPGNLYYVLSKRWFSRWEKFVGHSIDDPLADTDSGDVVRPLMTVADRPGPIDNSDIIENEHDNEGADLDILTTLLEGKDYVLVPQKVWEKLVQWYSGGPALPRKMISQGLVNKKQFSVEVYPLRLKLIDSRDNSEHTLRISKKASLHELYETVCSLRGIEKEKAAIWDYFYKHKDFLPSSSNKTLEESNLQRDQEILLELKHDGCYTNRLGEGSTGNLLALVPIEPSRSSLSIAGGPMMSNGHSSSYSLWPGSASNSAVIDIDNGFSSHGAAKIGDKGGLAGLQNMGNTCFMNSAIQCLVHTPPLVEYFLQDYSDEINSQNPLGMHGELALAFGDLLRKLWSSGWTTIAPRAFKGKLSQFAPQFSGYNQHDSQELLAFLLDGLHEDLNRVKRKPYMEMKDWNDHLDEDVADECWKYHKARNDSVIVDICQGQYKSTLVCPVCDKISITFDPFMYLSLPLPSTVIRPMMVTVFYGDGSGLPMPYTVSVLKSGNCGDLRRALGAACFLRNDENLLLAEVYEHKIYRLLENSVEPLISIKDEDHIVAYRLPGKAAGKMRLEIIHREKSVPEALKGSVFKYFGTPLITYLEADVLSGADIDDAVSRLLSPLKRTCSPVVAHSGKENDFLYVANGEASNSCDDQRHIRDHSLESTELESASSPEMLFHLSSTDDQCSSSKPIFKDSVIKLSNRLKIFVEWTEKEKRLYDPSYLKDLREVYQKTGFSSKKTKQEAISLFSCLEAFLKEEPLGPDDMWYCPTCKEHRQANKKLDLWRLPDILVFHLKRFSYSRFLKNKLDTFVDFPIHNLDLSKYVKKQDGQSYVYELYAISNHYGGLGGGHYTAFAKLIDDNQWYNFDDGHVSPASEAEIRTSAAYVLFYQRVKAEAREGLKSSSHGYPSS